MDKLSVTVAIPTYKNMPSMFFWNFLALEQTTRQKFSLGVVGSDNTLIDLARNMLIDSFLKRPQDYLFFLDSDMLVSPNIIELLVQSDKDIISGLYFGRSQQGETHIMASRRINGKYERIAEVPNDLLEVDAVGLGCCLVKKEVILSLDKKLSNAPLFKNKFESRLSMTGEDFYFCEIAKKNGYKIFLDPRIQCGHIGGVIDFNYYLANKQGK